MVKQIEQQNQELLALLNTHSEGLSRGQIAEKISFSITEKTLQRRLLSLVESARARRVGQRKAARYYSISNLRDPSTTYLKDIFGGVFSQKSQDKLQLLEAPVYSREKVTYNREFLHQYVPNQTAYVPEDMRAALLQSGKRFDQELAAGTYARQICQRLLIDLSYHSSRLEGNTYSLLDTQKLVEEGVSAEGKVQEETVMVMNHKEAIMFLVENAQDIQLDSLSMRNLHHLLSQDLLANPEACGHIRATAVDIGHSSYRPLTNPHVLRELFELVLQKAKKILDPFEQSFFLLLHLSYLQAFEDVNKRTSRLGCNIPFIKKNLCPLSFSDVTRDDYTSALLLFYETNDYEPLLELFAWAYGRSCEQYGVVKKSIGEIDAYRIQTRQQRKSVMGAVVRQGLHGTDAEAVIERYCKEHAIIQVERFSAMALADLSALHAGAIVGLGISEAQLEAWIAGRIK